MKLNEHLALSTSKVLLVPYSEHHVPTYHDWMQDVELQQATASEPLTLPEEYDMQKSWRTDGDKLTFIVCLAIEKGPQGIANARVHDGPDRMIGDVNLFIVEDDETEDATVAPLVGEVELMIARKDLHRSGYGRSTLLTFLYYVSSNLRSIVEEYRAQASKPTGQLEYLRVKIGQANQRSLALFESVGFWKVKGEPNYFGEYELRMSVKDNAVEELTGGKGFEMPTILQYHIEE